jgi:nucleotide-binding universal stress UspA family protein
MFQRILVATDGSARARAAFEWACNLAYHAGAEIVLLRVLPVVATDREFEQAHQMLDKLAEQGRSKGVKGHTLVAFGAPEEAIAMVARDEQSDLLVAAARPRGGLGAMTHPRLTWRLQAHAAVPVLIWPEHMPAEATDGPLARRGSSVLVPLDGSTYAEEALPLAASLAREYRRTLLLVRVVEPMPITASGAEAVAVMRTEYDLDAREVRGYLAAVRMRVANMTGLTVEAMMRTGDAADQFLHLAEGYPDSLIVMTTHGRSGLARFLTGSVAGDIVRRAHLPVLIIPPRAVREKTIPQLEQLAVDAVEH